MKKANKRNKLIFAFCGILIILIVSFSILSFFYSRNTYSNLENEKWDGVSVATSFFGGNGSEENPYLINSANEFALFNSLLAGSENNFYCDKYYKLVNNIDMDNHDILPFGKFCGSFDGDGYTISNILIDNPINVGGYSYYGVFSEILGSVFNVNFNNIKVIPLEKNINSRVGLLGGKLFGSVSNVSINNGRIDLENIDYDDSNYVGGLFSSLAADSSISNIFMDYELSSKYINNIGKVSYENSGNVENVFLSLDASSISLENIPNFCDNNMDVYYYDSNSDKAVLGKDEYSIKDIIKKINIELSNYYWNYSSGFFNLYQKDIPPEGDVISKSFSFVGSTPITLHDSGISNNVVYINDLTSDYNYYMGLNYTDFSNTGSLPTGVSRNLYNSSNLAQVYIEYNGQDLKNSSYVGYVSLSEQYSRIIYYKYYPIVNGYVTIELLDNPYGDRPDNLAFNGWITDYPGAIISIDTDTYVRYAKIPVSSTGPISITFNASWVRATTYSITSNNAKWADVYNGLDSAGMKKINYRNPIYESVDMRNYYIQDSVGLLGRYPNGAVNANGSSVSGLCWSSSCTYYIKSSDATYDPSVTYYRLSDSMIVYTPSVVGYNYTEDIPIGAVSSGYYRLVHLNNGNSLSGYYDGSGNALSGNCSGNSCNYYQLIQYYNGSNVNTFIDGEDYYYLVTRDTNIVVLRATNSNSIANTKPMTLTSVNNGVDYRNTNNVYYNIRSTYIKASSDLRLEWLYLYTNRNAATDDPSSSGTASSYIFGNYKNVKIGRGVNSTSSSRVSALAAVGGANNDSGGSKTSLVKYRFIVESGYYNVLSATNGNSNNNLYIGATAIYGSDIDRVSGNNNSLNVYLDAVGCWGGKLESASVNDIAINTIIKSGSFGTSKSEHTTGVYVGGRGSSSSSLNAARAITVEGGYIYNLIGGPLVPSSKKNINDIYMNIKGGTIDAVYGGAGTSATYGNRIINMTGGTINYSIFGGSNAYSGSDGDGTLDSSTFIYVGGNANVGSSTYDNSTLFGMESGSIFGIGNGKSTSSTIGTANNSSIVIDGSATIRGNVYGGGNYGALGQTSGLSSATTNINILGGTVNGSVYGGGNNNGSGSTSVSANINISMSGGNVKGSIYGGSRTKGTVYGNTLLNINGGSVLSSIYGGGEGGYTSSTAPGTFVTGNVDVNIGNSSSGPSISGNVYGGSAYGTVNGSSTTSGVSTKHTNVVVNNGTITGSVFGGGKGSSTFTPYIFGPITVTINNGSIGNVYGGNDQNGSPSTADYVYLNGGTIGNVFGGGNNTGQTATNVYLQGSNVTNLFGGSNSSGTVPNTNVVMTSGTVTKLYGGNNVGGSATNTKVLVSGGTVLGDIYGGGSLANSTTSDVTINSAVVNNVYGGGEKANVNTTNVKFTSATANGSIYGGSNISGSVSSSTVLVNSGNIVSVYGGNNQGGVTTNADITINNGTIGDVFGGGNKASTGSSNLTINNGNIGNVYGGGNEAGLTASGSNIDIFDGTMNNVYGGSNKSGNLSSSDILVGNLSSQNIVIGNLYGGNNEGGVTSRCYLDVNAGTIINVYGGGNEADVDSTNVSITDATVTGSVYGGGNQANVNLNTDVDIDNANILTNVYGGGNDGKVFGNTVVSITGSNIEGSVYAGGNGSGAIVSKNTTITLDGNNVIGTPDSIAPHSGCVFGSGNAAATGYESTNNSVATVNLVGGLIYGNVYGGANTSVVYGTTNTNIGMEAVNIDTLLANDIDIRGTVFGGGEANASGSEIYDFSFICVTTAININIDGTGYLDNSHDFLIYGSIFGSGNASSSSGTSDINIKHLGTRSDPSKNVSIQRADNVVIDESVIELSGTTDRTNEYSSIKYSFNRIDSLTIKNNTVLLLKQNANLLKSFNSMVDIDGEVVPATVSMDDDNMTVTKNVDNRLYLIANKNLNVTTNESATAYGKVTGMTFFGMYNSYASGSYGYGLYGTDFTYGSSADMGDAIIGGSYVMGLHSLNHDITKDGFYTNYLTDDYSSVRTAYIEPTPPDANNYNWLIGVNAINYTVNLNASKYSSLGTDEVSLIDFPHGDTTFTIVGFNTEGLASGVSLVDSNSVPKITETDEEANRILGLSMKTETREWTGYNTAKFLSADNGSYSGDSIFVTDSQSVTPSLMFYLYHAKNITLNQDIGTAIITLQASRRKNEIELDIQLITINVEISASNFEDGNAYDASISYGKKYEMPSATSVNITNQSQFSAYYSLFASADNFEEFYGRSNDYYHVLTSNYAFPIGTQITMIDYGIDEENPEYYYYNVTSESYSDSVNQLLLDNEVIYKLSDFIKMGSTSSGNRYDDATANLTYYNDTYNKAMEEFMFIFDLKETDTTGTHENNNILFELRNAEDRTLVSILGIRQNFMYFNTYDTSNMILDSDVIVPGEYLYQNIVSMFSLATSVDYDQTDNRESIINTNYESNSMGLNISLFDNSGNRITSSSLVGTYFKIDGAIYHADSDGVFRIKLSNKVSNLNKNIYFEADTTLPQDIYNFRFQLFASSDGVHNSHMFEATPNDFIFTLVGDDNAIIVDCDDEEKLIIGETGLNMFDKNFNSYTLKYTSVLSNPNVRVSLYKRDIDTSNSISYQEVDFNQVFSSYLFYANGSGYIGSSSYERVLTVSPDIDNNLIFAINEDVTSGTYKLDFKLYDGNQLIDDDFKYIIVKKNFIESVE